MSLDFYLERVQPTTVFDANQTHNVTSMWSLAGIYDDLYNSEGKHASDVIANLKRGFAEMIEEPKKYKKLNPDNGWGSYESALGFLEEVIKGCEEYPEAIIRISK